MLSDDIEELKKHEKLRLSEISKYNVENSIDKLTAKIKEMEDESNDILVQNMINAQDEVDFMAEETTNFLKLLIEERLQQTKLIEEQINNLPTNWSFIKTSYCVLPNNNTFSLFTFVFI